VGVVDEGATGSVFSWSFPTRRLARPQAAGDLLVISQEPYRALHEGLTGATPAA
jgi:hypothetical protein